MTIPHTDIAIDGTTAWLVGPDYTPAFIATLNRLCNLCEGHGAFMDVSPMRPCSACRGTGRHTFTLDVECGDSIHLPFVPNMDDDDPWYQPGDRECRQCDESGTRTLSVHVVDVLELVESGWFYTVATRGGFSKPTTLPTSAAPGMFAVQLEVHT
jgi:hypothetical protein